MNKHFQLFLDYHKILVAGGVGSVDVSFNDVEIIDLESSATTCQSFTSLPITTHSGIGGLGFGEEPFVCGGHDRVCFSFRDKSWIPENNLPEVLGHSAFCPSPFINENNKLFVTGGYTPGEWTNSSMVLTSDGWETLTPSLPVTVYDHCSVLLNSTTVMVIGGHQGLPGLPQNTYLFNANTNEWTEGPRLSTNRFGSSCGPIRSDATSLRFSIIVAGGDNLASVEILEDGANEWRRGPDLPFNIGFAAMVEDQTGGVILIGGSLSEHVELYDSIFRLAHAQAVWEQLPQKLRLKRRKLTAFLIPEGFVNCSLH